MALSYGEGIYGDAAGVVTPLDHRLAQIGGYTKTTTANLIRAGLFYNGTSNIVSGTDGMSYDVAAFSAVSTRGATQGVVPFANDSTANVVTTAAPGSNSRYDVVYAWPRDFAIDGTDSAPVLGVEQGTSAASPTVPSLAAYPGAIELARILVPSGVTATNSGTTITQTAPFTSVDGGTVPFRNTTAMNLWTTALTEQRAFDLATGTTYRYDGSAWRMWTRARVSVTPAVNGSITIGSGATLTMTYAVVDGWVKGYINWACSATTAWAAAARITLPIAPLTGFGASGSTPLTGSGFFWDSSLSRLHNLIPVLETDGLWVMRSANSSSTNYFELLSLSASTPNAPAASDYLRFGFEYPVA